MANDAEQAIYSRLASAPTFHPSSTTLLPSDWTIEPGDIVTVKSGTDSYSVPIYSLNLNWTGSNQDKSANASRIKIGIESTGNEKREPLPELKRKQFEQSRYAYSGFKAQQEEIDEHYQHVVNVTDKGMSDAFGIIGVKIGDDGYPVYDANGNPVWDDSGTGGEIWGHLNRSAWSTQILNHIKDANGNIISLAEVYTDAYGNAIINAINDQRTGTATINANRIKLQATDTITLDALLGINADGDLSVKGDLSVQGDISVSGIVATGKISGRTIEWDSGHGVLTMEDMYDDFSTCIDSIGPATASGGEITIPWTKFDGSSGSVNFNIAATQFYIDGVAARTASSIESITLGSGDTGVSNWTPTVFSADDYEVDVPLEIDASAVYAAGQADGKASVSFDKSNLTVNIGSSTNEWAVSPSKEIGRIYGYIGVKYGDTDYGALRSFSISAPKVTGAFHDSRTYASDLVINLDYDNGGGRTTITSRAR